MLNHVKKLPETKQQTKTKKTSLDSASSSSKPLQDENPTKTRSHMTSTPRSHLQKTASDVYAMKKNPITGKKAINNPIPISSNSIGKVKTSTSKEKSLSKKESNSKNTPRIKGTASSKIGTNLNVKDNKTRRAKDLPYVNVTVNSPPSRRKEVAKEESADVKKTGNAAKETNERQRQKTRTLDDSEVKVLTPDAVDNNEEMKNLTRKLNARPKSFFVDLEQPKRVVKEQIKNKSSDEDVSYEDDFESYESDFESYHSEDKSDDISGSDETEPNIDKDTEINPGAGSSKIGNDEEDKMLDSGHFEWNDIKKNDKFTPMDNIDEVLENVSSSGNGEAKKMSLTDEGFQEMSSSSGVSSTKTTHTDVLERELFIDFQKSKNYKKKRQSVERFRQRAKDLLGVINLHETSHVLFEMKPIPYDVYMATFGRSNYVQECSQTFEDGITVEIQTEEIDFSNKWTQHPVKFSNREVYLNSERVKRKKSRDFIANFNFFLEKETEIDDNAEMTRAGKFKNNPLRILLDQRNGVGRDVTIRDEVFENKLKSIDYDPSKLKKFLKKIEGRMSNVLSVNSGYQQPNDFSKKSKWNFSEGYKSLLGRNLNEGYLKCRRVSKCVFSDQKSNLIMTVHNKNVKAIVGNKSLACLWDINVANVSPLKVLVAIDNIALCVFRGNADGIFVSALEDGSIHLWDLSEQPTWMDTGKVEAAAQDYDMEKATKTQTELDREYNKNSREQSGRNLAYRACAYTSSACAVRGGHATDKVVGLEFVPRPHDVGRRGDRTVAQVCSLQRNGVLTVWTIIQEKSKTVDMGKAFWSKCRLQRTQSVNFLDFIEVPPLETAKFESHFNLTAAKKRVLSKRCQRKQSKNANSTVKNIDNTSNVASTTRKLALELPSGTEKSENWESGLLCSTLKIILYNETEYYLVGRNCGEILFCTRIIGIVKVKRIVITNVSTTITAIESSSHNLPCFLVGTDTGNIHMCSIQVPERAVRVLLSLYCGSSSQREVEKIHSDHRGRYLSTSAVASTSVGRDEGFNAQVALKSIGWLSDPCRLVALSVDGTLTLWDFKKSDIHATYRCRSETNYICFNKSDTKDYMAVLTTDGELEVHRMSTGRRAEDLNLFNRYLSLL